MRKCRLEMSGVDPDIRLFPRMTSAAMNAGGRWALTSYTPGIESDLIEEDSCSGFRFSIEFSAQNRFA